MYLGVAQLVARYLGVVEAAGSSPVTQIENPETIRSRIFSFSDVIFTFSHCLSTQQVRKFPTTYPDAFSFLQVHLYV